MKTCSYADAAALYVDPDATALEVLSFLHSLLSDTSAMALALRDEHLHKGRHLTADAWGLRKRALQGAVVELSAAYRHLLEVRKHLDLQPMAVDRRKWRQLDLMAALDDRGEP